MNCRRYTRSRILLGDLDIPLRRIADDLIANVDQAKGLCKLMDIECFTLIVPHVVHPGPMHASLAHARESINRVDPVLNVTALVPSCESTIEQHRDVTTSPAI